MKLHYPSMKIEHSSCVLLNTIITFLQPVKMSWQPNVTRFYVTSSTAWLQLTVAGINSFWRKSFRRRFSVLKLKFVLQLFQLFNVTIVKQLKHLTVLKTGNWKNSCFEKGNLESFEFYSSLSKWFSPAFNLISWRRHLA